MIDRPDADLSIVITAYNSLLDLQRCLPSVFDSAHAARLGIQVLLIDNASTDGTAQYVRTVFPSVRIVTNSRNVGFAAASNQGLRLCGAEYVLLLNPDTVLHHDNIREMLAFMTERPRVGIGGCKILNPDASLQPSCRTAARLLTEACELLGVARWLRLPGCTTTLISDPGWYEGQHEVGSLLGAYLLVRRACMEDVGLLDERFFMYAEEVDWCWRARSFGWVVAYNGRAEITHHGRQVLTPRPAWQYVQLRRSRYQLAGKHLGRRAVYILGTAAQVGDCFRLVDACAKAYVRPGSPSSSVQKERLRAQARLLRRNIPLCLEAQ